MNSLFLVWLDNVRFAGEVHHVMSSRIAMLSTGDVRCAPETIRMFSEKAAAFAEAQIDTAAAVMTGQSMQATIRCCLAPYQRRVRANSKRLRKNR